MEIIRKECKLCLCCMEKHEVSYIRVKEKNIFKGQEVEYEAIYEYCDKADEVISSEEMTTINDLSFKNAYRKKVGLLETSQICAIRQNMEYRKQIWQFYLIGARRPLQDMKPIKFKMLRMIQFFAK